MANSIEKPAKITKAIFISAVVHKPFKATNKGLAAELGISEAYFYKLLRRYSPEINKELGLKKAKIRLKAIGIIEARLNSMDEKTALDVLKQIGWSDSEVVESNGIVSEQYFITLIKLIKQIDTGGLK